MRIFKKGIFLSLAIGEASGLLLLMVLKNLSQEIEQINLIPWWFLPVFFPIFCLIWFLVTVFLGKFFKLFNQLGRFVLVGGLNFLVDLGILNLLIFLTEINQGGWYSVFKAAAFSVAVINSYILNRWWTFQSSDQDSQKVDTGWQFAQFIIVSLIGLGVNNAVASGLVNLIGPQFGINPDLWANLGAIAASFVGMFWNFIGYKFIVFKK